MLLAIDFGIRFSRSASKVGVRCRAVESRVHSLTLPLPKPGCEMLFDSSVMLGGSFKCFWWKVDVDRLFFIVINKFFSTAVPVEKNDPFRLGHYKLC